MASEPLRPYDLAAWERFCSALVREGFNPLPGTERRRWIGPIRESLQALTDARTMIVRFLDGWPVRAARIDVPGLAAEHVTPSGYICLWADDDPAQARAVELAVLWDRLDAWTVSALEGFNEADRALDAYALFPGSADLIAEIDLPALLSTASNGYIKHIHGAVKGTSILRITESSEDAPLRGSVYLRGPVERPPRSYEEFRALLRRRQLEDLDERLAHRADVGENEPSGGMDFAVLAWPRHGQRDALVLTFKGAEESLRALPNVTTPSDQASRLRRAGPDAGLLASKRVLIAGVGAIGGYVAKTLASSGLTFLKVRDWDAMKIVNLTRHIEDSYAVGYPKAFNTATRIRVDLPWCEVVPEGNLPHDPVKIETILDDIDLVVDCTGNYSITVALATACSNKDVPLVTAALYHHGAILRVRRQANGDMPIVDRHADSRYVPVPPETSTPGSDGFLELGCTSPVHNSPPTAVLRAAADVSAAAIDVLTGRMLLDDEVLTVLNPLPNPPFDRLGSVTSADFPAVRTPPPHEAERR